jgi:hypothetical protein
VYDFKVPMTTQRQFALYPVVLAPAWDDNPFDESQLPASILPGVTIENIKSHVPRDEFDHFQDYLSKRDIDALHDLNSSIVYRYDPDTSGEEHQEAEAIVRNIAACLMLIRPTTKRMGFMRGQIRWDGTFKFESFDNPRDDVNVSMVQRLFAVRNGDLLRLQSVAEEFIRAMNGQFWKFRIPLVLYESGHFAHHYWKGRYALWCSALDAIYTTQPEFDKAKPYEHTGSLVAKARIRWFLGEKTSIYAPGDIQTVDAEPSITIGEVLDDLYELRNAVVHGDRTPERFFKETRIAYGQSVNRADVLHEALSFIIRSSLLRILEDRLLQKFADGSTSRAYFAQHGLVKSLLQKPKLKKPKLSF